MIDIDTLVPESYRVKNDSSGKPVRIFLDSRTKSLGVTVEKMIDWRGLESRMTDLQGLWQIANNKFWGAMREASPNASRENEAWFHTGRSVVIVYTGMGYAIRRTDEVIEDLTRTQRHRRPFHLIPESLSRDVDDLRLRSERLLSAFCVYKAAFRRSIEDRLRHAASQEDICKSKTIVLSVSGRRYPICLPERLETIKWLPDIVDAS